MSGINSSSPIRLSFLFQTANVAFGRQQWNSYQESLTQHSTPSLSRPLVARLKFGSTTIFYQENIQLPSKRKKFYIIHSLDKSINKSASINQTRWGWVGLGGGNADVRPYLEFCLIYVQLIWGSGNGIEREPHRYHSAILALGPRTLLHLQKRQKLRRNPTDGRTDGRIWYAPNTSTICENAAPITWQKMAFSHSEYAFADFICAYLLSFNNRGLCINRYGRGKAGWAIEHKVRPVTEFLDPPQICAQNQLTIIVTLKGLENMTWHSLFNIMWIFVDIRKSSRPKTTTDFNYFTKLDKKSMLEREVTS